jgi:hypothetical protein
MFFFVQWVTDSRRVTIVVVVVFSCTQQYVTLMCAFAAVTAIVLYQYILQPRHNDSTKDITKAHDKLNKSNNTNNRNDSLSIHLREIVLVYGIILPVWVILPSQVLYYLDLRNYLFKFVIGVVSPTLCLFRTTEGKVTTKTKHAYMYEWMIPTLTRSKKSHGITKRLRRRYVMKKRTYLSRTLFLPYGTTIVLSHSLFLLLPVLSLLVGCCRGTLDPFLVFISPPPPKKNVIIPIHTKSIVWILSRPCHPIVTGVCAVFCYSHDV